MLDLTAAKYGVVLFDNNVSPATGWASVDGSPSFFISSTGDLDTNTTWITNIDANNFAKIGLNKTPRFRPENFLRTKLSSILFEIGRKDAPPKEQARCLSEIAGSVMKYAEIHLGITTAPFGALNNGIRQIFMPSERPEPIDVIEAAESAFQTYVNCERSSTHDDDDEIISLLMPRYQYAKQIVASRLPWGKWGVVPLHSVGSTRREIEHWITRCDKPLLLQIQIERMAPNPAKLVNYGNGAGMQINKSQIAGGGSMLILNKHEWVTSIEYAALKEYAVINVEKILIAESWAANPVSIPLYGQYSELAFPFGLYCESLWTSLTRSVVGKAAKTPISAWIHSIDRMLCFNKAMLLLENHNQSINGYGYGRIVIKVPKPEVYKVPELCLNHGLISPMFAPGLYSQFRLPSNTPTSAQLLQVAMARGERGFLANMNEKTMQEAKTRTGNSRSLNFTM